MPKSFGSYPTTIFSAMEQDQAWPAGVLDVFERSARDWPTFPDRYDAAYSTLLRYCFGFKPLKVIAPGNPYSHRRAPGHSTHPIVFFVVYDLDPNKPILLVEIKDDECAPAAVLRRHADEQMRELYEEKLAKCPLPRLWGLSLLGTSMRVYCGDTTSHTINPPVDSSVIPPGSDRALQFLAGEWDLDILSQEGFEKMKEVIGEIKGHK